VREAMERAKRRTAERRTRNDQAAREYEQFLERIAVPLFRQIGIVLRRDKPRTPVLDAFLATLDDLRRSLA